MHYKVVLFLTFVAAASGFQLDVSNSTDDSERYEISANSSCKAIFSCLNCTTTRLCKPGANGTFIEIQKMKCPKALPYCNVATGTCSSVQDKSCGEKSPSFICFEDGNFPDNNCKVYHVCKKNVATKFRCTGSNYNAKIGICDKNATCGTMKCEHPGRKVAHSVYPNYFANCGYGSSIIGRCPGKYELNETSQLCESTCHEEGVQQDMDDCTKYYKCQYTWIENTKIMIKSRLDCPEGTGFDPSNYICVTLPSPALPKCKPPK